MSLLNFTGFEIGDTTDCFIASTGTFSIQSGIKRTGAYALRVNPTTSATGNVQIASVQTNGTNINASVSLAFFRFYLYVATAPASAEESFFYVQNISSVQKFYLTLTSTLNIKAYDANSTLLATGATALSPATWYLIEVKVSTGAGAAYEVKLNGVSEISGTGALTGNTTQRCALGKFMDLNSQSIDLYYDDFAWSDSAYLGAGQCSILVPAANGTYQTFTVGAGAGSHYQIVNEVPPNGDTSYLLSTRVTGNAETEILQTRQDAGITVGTVNGVKAYVNAKSNGGPNGSYLIRLRSGSTNFDSASTLASASYTGMGILHRVDPATAGAWLPVALDTLQVGLVENTISVQSRVSAIYGLVDYVPGPSFNAAITSSNIGTGF